jgi:hypothetical protein
MSREHAPIEIGLRPEVAWRTERVEPITLVAFVAGDELPDPGEAFLSLGSAFRVEPTNARPVPSDDPALAWAVAFDIPGRAGAVLMWCERVDPGHTPDGRAPDARWAIGIESVLERSSGDDRERAIARGLAAWPASVADFVALAAAAAGCVDRARLRILYEPALARSFAASDCARLFLGDGVAPGALVDERFLYRVEARMRTPETPAWISTVGLARLARPELEVLEVPPALVGAALELVDALAARLVTEEPPHPGVPIEVGEQLSVALVPAHEAAETIAADAPGGRADRIHLAPISRAAICAAGQRGSFRRVWVAPIAELERLAQNETGLFLALRVVEVRERIARDTWPRVAAAFADRPRDRDTVFMAKIALERAAVASGTEGEPEHEPEHEHEHEHEPKPDAPRAHVWLRVEAADASGGRGISAEVAGGSRAFTLADIGDWRVIGLFDERPNLGPDDASFLAI